MKNFLAISICLISLSAYASQKLSLTDRFSPIPRINRDLLNLDFQAQTQNLIDAFNSGDIVGNGGGLIEQNFQFAYNSVLSAIDHCMIKLNCQMSPKEKILLMDIKSTYFLKFSETHHFIFLKENEAQSLFSKAVDPSERIAKTGFSHEFPIFINLTQIEQNPTLINDLGAQLAIILHELGHQAGYSSHSLLDSISSKVRAAFNYQMTSTSLKVVDEDLLVNIYNSSETLETQVSYFYNNQVRFLTYTIQDQLACQESRSPIGYSLSNQHWERLSQDEEYFLPKLKMWIDIYCEDSTGTIFTRERDIEVNFKINKKTKKFENHTIQIK